MSEYVNKESIKSTTYKAVKEQFGFIYYEDNSYIAKSDLEKLEKNPDKFLINRDKKNQSSNSLFNTIMKSIIFNQHQVNYALKNKEGMFRVVVKPYLKFNEYVYFGNSGFAESEVISNKSPYQVKETIFVKETWGRKATGSGIAYKVDNPNALIYQHLPVKWKLAQHMKQEHSRLTLRIKSVKVERLAEISRGDCMDEGCPFPNIAKETDPKEWFKEFWNSTHKKPEEKFEANPFCFVYEYEVIKK